MPLTNAQDYINQAIASIKVSAPTVIESEGISIPHEDMPVLKDLGNGLYVAYLVDDGISLAYVQNHHLSATKTNIEDLHQIGIKNLTELSDGKARMKQYGEVYLTFFDDIFEASLILRDDLWEDELAFMAPNGFIAALPARCSLAVCDAKFYFMDAELSEFLLGTFPSGF